MLIVEGPDGGGKTTLAHRLCAELALQYRRPPKNLLSSSSGPVDPEGLINWWEEQLVLCHEDPVYERQGCYDRTTYISDLIYRLATGGTPCGSPMRMMHGIFRLCNYAMIVFCIPPWEKAERVLQDAERVALDGLDLERAYNVHWAYEVQMHLWKEAAGTQHVLHYDWRNYDFILEEVREYVA